MTILSDLPCERCGARIPWDQKSPSVTCPYCQAHMRTPIAVARPVPLQQTRSRSPIGCILAVAGAAFALAAIAVGVVLLRSSAPTPAPSVVTSVVVATPPTGKAAAGSDV